MSEHVNEKTTFHDEATLEIYDIETDTRTVLKEFDHIIEAPNWSPDGSYLLFNSRGRLFRYELASGEITEIDTEYAVGCNNDHVISSDGSFYAISSSTADEHMSRIFTLSSEGGTPRLVTPLAPSYLHGMSPDMKTLVYCARRDGVYDVYSIPTEGGTETRLTYTPGLDDGPEFDSAGEYIWFCSTRSGLMQVWRMCADGSHRTQITFDTERNTWFPHISPDRRKVVALAYRRGDLLPHEHLRGKQVELRLMDADGKNVRTLVSLYGGQGTINVNSWSPDSRRFAFVSYRRVADDKQTDR